MPGSKKNLFGDNPDKALVESFSNETQVNKDTPPTFLAHTDEDAGVPAENSLLFALALRKAKVPCELHLFQKGIHGLGLGTGWGDPHRSRADLPGVAPAVRDLAEDPGFPRPDQKVTGIAESPSGASSAARTHRVRRRTVRPRPA